MAQRKWNCVKIKKYFLIMRSNTRESVKKSFRPKIFEVNIIGRMHDDQISDYTSGNVQHLFDVFRFGISVGYTVDSL